MAASMTAPATPRAPLRKLAIVVGFVVDIAGTILTGGAVIVAAIVVASIQSDGKNQDFVASWSRDPVYLVALIGIGVVWVIAGGFAAGMIARRDYLRHAAWVGITTTAWALLFALPPESEPAPPVWFEMTSYAISIPSAILGGYLAQRWHT